MEAPQRTVGQYKTFLREIVCQRGVALREVPEKAPHRRLVPLHELPERRAIVLGERPCDQLDIWGHERGRVEAAAADSFLAVRRRIVPESSRPTPMKPGIAPT